MIIFEDPGRSKTSNMASLTLRLFGHVTLTRGPLSDIALPRKTQMLLAYLASNTEQQFTRDRLAGLIWPDRGEEQARHSLRQCLFTLAKSIGDGTEPLVHADRHSVWLNPDIVQVDTWNFERLLAEDTPDAMQQAVAVHLGDFLAGISFDDEILDTWCAGERTRFRDLCYETLSKLSSHYADTARLDEAIDAGRRLIALDPLREDGHRTLMRLFGRTGRRAEALKQYHHCLDILRTELNVEPEAATVELHSEIKGRGNEAEVAPETADYSPGMPPNRTSGAKDEPEPAAYPAIFVLKRVILAVGLLFIIVLASAIFWNSVGQ